MTIYNGDLIVGGTFTAAGGVPADNIARWDGAWHALGAGVGGKVLNTVRALAIYNSQLIIGGNFLNAGSVTANGIAAWDGANWSALGTGVAGTSAIVRSLATFNGELYAGGYFASRRRHFQRDARWNSSSGTMCLRA